MAIKATKKSNYAEIREILESMGREDLVSFVDNEIESLSKTSSAQMVKNAENQKICDIIAKALEDYSDGLSITKLITSIADLSTFSNQKISRLCNDMVKEGRLEKVKVNSKEVAFRLPVPTCSDPS